MVRYLDKDALVEINRKAVAVNCDPHVLLNEANLHHLLCSLEYKYENNRTPITAKAAHLMHYISDTGHIFLEGNKRTAAMAAASFLELNGLSITEKGERELASFILKIASGGVMI
ncbi:type II toxin-antitoxin system death-on-curing family toxin [Candidatus Micrarchaeota archaeon]|nr:type II toxin-antitoxin system death-on-curing family toxin [Candidatus Micrarchaeota archaeon]